MRQIKKVLAPIDLSERSRPAVEHAVNIADHFGAKVIVLHAIPTIPGVAARQRRVVDEIIARFLREVAPGVDINRIVARGDAAQLIKDAVAEHDIRLIVMPTSGAGAFRRFLLGSTTTKVLNDLDCPVLTGAHVDDISPFGLRPYKKVGCALDLTEGSEAVVQKAQAFAMSYRAEVLPIHTVQFHEGRAQYLTAESEKGRTFDGILERAKAAIRNALAKTDVSAEPVVRFGAPEYVIPEVAEKRNLDLLIVGRHSSEGTFNGLLTHAYGLIRKAPCPVLSV